MEVITRMEGLEKIIATLERMTKDAPRATAQAMYTAALRILTPEIRQNIKNGMHVFRGQLHQRVGARLRKATRGGEVAIEVGSLQVPYGAFVELGWRPGEDTVDEDKIREYVQKKMQVPMPEGEPLVRAIIRTLETRGGAPHPFVMPAWDTRRDEWLADTLARLRARLEAA
jgi:hypothetical protein